MSMARNMRGASIARYGDVAAEVGLDAQAMLRRLDIDPRVLTQPDRRCCAGSISIPAC
jgi:hypothetical protein